ncbi:unnamed protein product, partial [marine sediment metagenome]
MTSDAFDLNTVLAGACISVKSGTLCSQLVQDVGIFRVACEVLLLEAVVTHKID